MKSSLQIKDNASLNNYQEYVRNLVIERGFNNNVEDSLIHMMSEVGELSKEIKRKKQDLKEISHEMADIFIFLVDIANQYNISLEKAFKEKEEINKQRKWE